MEYTHNDIVAEALLSSIRRGDLKLTPGMKILEIGAGLNPMKRVFEAFIDNVTYICIDNESEYKNENNIIMDANNLQFGDESFDLVYMSHVSEHFENPVQCFKEIHRVLKKDGVLFNASPYPCIHQILGGDTNHIFVLSDIQLMKLLNYVGFSKFETVYVKREYQQKMVLKEQDWNVIMVAIK